jgi:CheY-like chemotaxis protein
LHSTATPDADAVVLDYMLSDGNGVELGVELLQEKRELTVIVITGTILPLEEENLCEEHNFLVLRKPFSPEQLAHLIFERLAERHLSAKLRSIDDDPGLSAANLSIAFDPRLKPGQITEVLTALADYYRACGGVGFQIEFELDNLIGSDQVNVA